MRVKNGEKKGQGFSGTSIKDPWTKPKEGKDRGWEVWMAGVGGVVRGKWRPLYLNNNKKNFLNI